MHCYYYVQIVVSILWWFILFCTLQALRQPQGSRLLQPRMELDFAETLPI